MVDQELVDLFMSSLSKADLNGCIMYVGGGRHQHGYPVITHNYKRYYAHRLAYEVFIGPVVQKAKVMPCPKSKLCCNPNHLTLKTYSWTKEVNGLQRCIRCNILKPTDEFRLGKSGKRVYLRTECRACGAEATKRWYRRVDGAKYMEARRERDRTVAAAYRQCGCPICGECFVKCLTFHHIDPSNKIRISRVDKYSGKRHTKGLTVMGELGNSEKRFLEEIAKCIVLCHNCHFKYHAGIIEITELHMHTIQFVQLYQFLKSQGIDVDAVLRGEPNDDSSTTHDES